MDVVEVPPYSYVVLLAQAAANCDALGACGAAGDSTLIWLKLDVALVLVAKQAFAFEDCEVQRSALIRREGKEVEFPTAKDLPWQGSELRIDYEELGRDDHFRAWQLVYDRSHPDAGLEMTPVTHARRGEPPL